MPAGNRIGESLPTALTARRNRGRGIGVLLLLGVHAGLLAWGAIRNSTTYDEPYHLVAGVRHWQCGRFDLNRGNPPLVDLIAALPVLAAGPETDWSRVETTYTAGCDFLAANGPRIFRLTTLGRLALIPLSLLGGYVCFRWARELYGYGGGLVALVLWCFSPNILAHGQLATGDLASAALGITATYAFWKWLSRPSLGRAALAGVLLGLAELSKYVCVIFYVLWPVLWIAWRWLHRGQGARPSLVREAAHGVLILVLSLYVIHLGYGFERPFPPLERFRLGRRLLSPIDAVLGGQGESDTAAAAPRLGSLPVPLPENYLLGVDEISEELAARRPSYLRGRLREGGWWYYYPYALLVKLPLGTLALAALAGILFMTRPGDRQTWKTELVLLIVPLVALLCFVTWSGSRQTLRYVLPIFPFAFIWAAKTGRVLSRNRRGPAILVTACLAWTAADSLWVYPHSVSYFNALVGGPRHGHDHLIDANIDLGQDLLYLKRWYDAHPEARPLHLAYFGTVDPRFAGIEFSPPPRAKPSPLSGVESTADPWGPRPGWFAVSVHLLRIHRRPVPDGKGGFEIAGGEDYDYFLHFRPVALAGYSVYLYQIECAEANRVRRQLGMSPLSCQDGLE